MWLTEGSTYDNVYLSKEAIEEFERSLSGEEKECRIHGKALHLAGLVYKEFQWDRHVMAKQFIPPKTWPHYFYIDPHPQTPHCVLFLAVNELGQRFYYKDLFVHCSIATLAEAIHEELDGCFVVRGRIDPIAYVNDPLTDSNMAEELARYGVLVERATKALAQGILRVQGELAKT